MKIIISNICEKKADITVFPIKDSLGKFIDLIIPELFLIDIKDSEIILLE